MADLGFAAAGFSEKFGDRLGLDPVAEDGVERDGPRGDALDGLLHLLLLETYV